MTLTLHIQMFNVLYLVMTLTLHTQIMFIPCYDINITHSDNALYIDMTLTLPTQLMFYTLL